VFDWVLRDKDAGFGARFIVHVRALVLTAGRTVCTYFGRPTMDGKTEPRALSPATPPLHIAETQFTSGVCLECGKGVEIDLTSAADYYNKSADQGNACAQLRYGACLAFGRGVTRNVQLAADFYKQSADQGNGIGETRYGLRLDFGRGVVQPDLISNDSDPIQHHPRDFTRHAKQAAPSAAKFTSRRGTISSGAPTANQQ
jgi:TPR repeat protein